LTLIDIRALNVDEIRPYGWVLGQAIRQVDGLPAFSDANTDFRQEHIFHPGSGGETEMLWVNYRDRKREISTLEVHRLTEQAVVPLTGEIIQVVAGSQPDGAPDIASLRAFRVRVGEGLCMRAGCWHTTRVDAPEVKCLMLTRRSTTIDLIAHLTSRSPLSESERCPVDGSIR
jgi:ureidoglycolate lyase